jgi:vacuolar protein sorting-associated protein VTA1
VSPTRATNAEELMKGTSKLRRGSGSSTGSAGSGGALEKKAWVSEEIDPHAANQYYFSQRDSNSALGKPESAGTSGSDGSKKSVRFTPSVVGGMSDGGTPQISPVQDGQGHPSIAAGWPTDPSIPVGYGNLPQYPQSQGNVHVDVTALPPGFVPHSSDWGASAPPLPIISPPSPPKPSYYSSPQLPHISAPQPVHGQPVQNLSASGPPVELSPSIIAKVQKHCRFAISALDYEDATQARKELRAALAALGG